MPHEGGKKKRYIMAIEGKGLTTSLVLIWLHVNQLYDRSTMTKCFYSLNSGRRPWLAAEPPELSPAGITLHRRAPAPKGLNLSRWRGCPSIIFSFIRSEARRKEMPNFCSARSWFQGSQMRQTAVIFKGLGQSGWPQVMQKHAAEARAEWNLLGPSLVH